MAENDDPSEWRDDTLGIGHVPLAEYLCLAHAVPGAQPSLSKHWCVAAVNYVVNNYVVVYIVVILVTRFSLINITSDLVQFI